MARVIADGPPPDRVLVFRTGSLGDTAFNLPIFHHLNRIWPDAEKRVLTNFPVAAEAPPLQAVLGDFSFAQGYFEYPGGTRSIAEVRSVARRIRAWRPDVAIYANERRPLAATLRDGLFLKLCGVKRLYGLPLSRDVRAHRFDAETGLYEREVSRIARALSVLGEIDTDEAANRDLLPSDAETAAAQALLSEWDGNARFLAFSPGTKQAVKDWTDANWIAAFATLSADDPDLGLAIVGAPEDRERADRLAAHWRGPVLNCCGRANPRESAAVIGRAAAFLGNDSGPMHLAASVGVTAVAVFSTLAPPGVWFPLGKAHRIFYPRLAWSGGYPPVLREAADEPDLTEIPVAQVVEACREALRQ